MAANYDESKTSLLSKALVLRARCGPIIIIERLNYSLMSPSI